MATCKDAIDALSETVAILSQQVAQSQPNALAIQQLTNILNNQLVALQNELNVHDTEITALQSQIALILPSGFLKTGPYSINGVANPGGDIELVAGSGIVITNDPVTKRITIAL